MKFVKIFFALAILVVILAIGVFYWAFSNLNRPTEHAKANQYVVIERGSSPGQIIDKLSAEGIVANPWLCGFISKPRRPVENAGRGYKFASPITPWMCEGAERFGSNKRLTIREGYAFE